MRLIVAILATAIGGDVIELDLGPLGGGGGNSAFVDRTNSVINSDELHSDFGVFVSDVRRRPRFRTRRNGTMPVVGGGGVPATSHIQKITTRFDTNDDVRSRVKLLLKHYLDRIYAKKYGNGGGGAHESKFLWAPQNKTVNINKKFLSLFTIVQFANSQCQATNAASDYEGTCYHQIECDNLNGTALGDCANGYGVCCVFKFSCDGSSSQNCSYFESPNYPNYYPADDNVAPPDASTPPPTTANPSPTPDPRLPLFPWGRQDPSSLACTFMVNKASSDIQQLRIDFIDFELRGPTNGTCMDERFVITGQAINNPIPDICGYNTGQHVYVDVSSVDGPVQLSVMSVQPWRKRFKMQICQIATACPGTSSCLQYYTGVTGVVSTFNYDQVVSQNRSYPSYFNNLNYDICIQREPGYCSITYTNMQGGIEYPFRMRNVDDAGHRLVPFGQAGVGIFYCPDDYVLLAGVRLCGQKLNDGAMIEDFRMNAPVTDTSTGPIVIQVRTDDSDTTRGFKLFYMQNQCN